MLFRCCAALLLCCSVVVLSLSCCVVLCCAALCCAVLRRAGWCCFVLCFAGLAVLLDLAIATAGAMVHLAIVGFLPLAFLPPLVFAHRHFLFTLMSRRFEGKQRLQDGGFMAALLDIANHQAGDPYWIHLPDARKDKRYNTTGSTLMSPL